MSEEKKTNSLSDVEQKTIGDNSPNINAPNTKTVQVNYNIQPKEDNQSEGKSMSSLLTNPWVVTIIGGVLVTLLCSGIFYYIKHGKGEEKKTISSSSVEQKTTGNNSPNINAPNAVNIKVIYGITPEQIEQWLEKNAEGKNHEQLKELRLQLNEMAKILEQQQRLAGMAFNKSVVAPLTQFSGDDFLNNFKIFMTYYQYRKTLQLLNPEKLIELLNIYFKSVISFQPNTKKQYYVNARGGALFLLEIKGHNENNENILITLPELSTSLINDVCTDFIKSAKPEHYEKLLYLFECALATQEIDKRIKSDIIAVQNNLK